MNPTPMTPEQLGELFKQLSNWGRWGDDDERGALNLITERKRAEAAALVSDGVTVSCALELPKDPGPGNPNPVRHTMVRAGDVEVPADQVSGASDYIAIAPHGAATTHLDALCHIFYEGKMYNGYDKALVTSTGTLRNSIMSGQDGIVSRGVLLDVPATLGVPYLQPGDRIGLDDIEATVERAGVTVSEGDILLVRTGRDALRDERGPWDPYTEGIAGLAAECLPWIHERGVAVLGCDGISDPLPYEGPPSWCAFHLIALVSMGIHLIDNMQLGRLATACAERNRWEFLFTLAPLRLDKGTASPLNPIAML